MRTLKIPRGIFNAVCYTADGEYLVGLHSGWRLRVWATSDFSERYAAPLPGVRHAHDSMALVGDLAVLNRGVYGLTDLWGALRRERGRVNDPALIRELALKESESPYGYVTYATERGVIVRAYYNPSVRRVDVGFWERARLVRSLSLPFGSHLAPALSPDGRSLIVFAGRHTIFYHCESGEEAARLEHTDATNRAVFSPDGQRLAVAAGRSLWLWDLATKQGVRFPAFDTFVEGLAYSPDGSRLAAADRTGEIRLLEAASGRQLGCLNFEVGAIHDLAFSPDGMTVAGAGHDNAVVVWDLA